MDMAGNIDEWCLNKYDTPEDTAVDASGAYRVLRGGAWPTRGRMIRNTWRTYYGPERNDVFAGFRTCAL